MNQKQTLFMDLKLGDTFTLSSTSFSICIKTGHKYYALENDPLVIQINVDTPVIKILNNTSTKDPKDTELRSVALDKAIRAYAHENPSPTHMTAYAQVFYDYLLNGYSKI